MHQSADQWQAREDQVALQQEARERRDLRWEARLTREDLSVALDEFEYRRTSGETPAERDTRLYYSLPQACADPNCKHILGMHDVGYGKCYERGCGCQAFQEPKQYDRMRLTPAGEVLPARTEAA